MGSRTEARQSEHSRASREAGLQTPRQHRCRKRLSGEHGVVPKCGSRGKAWRLAHGSEEGLGDYLLHAYDDVVASSETARPKRNANAKEPYDFTLRKAQDGSLYSLADQK